MTSPQEGQEKAASEAGSPLVQASQCKPSCMGLTRVHVLTPYPLVWAYPLHRASPDSSGLPRWSPSHSEAGSPRVLPEKALTIWA